MGQSCGKNGRSKIGRKMKVKMIENAMGDCVKRDLERVGGERRTTATNK